MRHWFTLGILVLTAQIGFAGAYFLKVFIGKQLTLRLVLVAVGGTALAWWQTPPWTIFALVAFGMAAYGLAVVVAVRATRWGPAG